MIKLENQTKLKYCSEHCCSLNSFPKWNNAFNLAHRFFLASTIAEDPGRICSVKQVAANCMRINVLNMIYYITSHGGFIKSISELRFHCFLRSFGNIYILTSCANVNFSPRSQYCYCKDIFQ